MIVRRIALNRPVTNVRVATGASAVQAAASLPTEAERAAQLQAATARAEAAAKESAAIEALFERTFEAVQDMETRRQQSLSDLQTVAVELAVAIATRLTYQAVDAGEFGVESMVQQVLARLNSPHPVVIRLHPSDLELLNRRVQGKPPPWSADTPLQFVPDTSLNRGDCRGEAQHITILSDVELQLSEIRRHLLENLSDASERRANPSGSGNVRRFPDRRETA